MHSITIFFMTACLDGLSWGTVLPVPGLDQRDVDVPPGAARPLVEGARGPHQRDAVGGVVGVQGTLLNIIIVIFSLSMSLFCSS